MPAAGPLGSAAEPRYRADTIARLTVRWLFLAVATAFAFRESLESLYESTVGGSLNGYLWLMPLAAVVALIGIARRDRREIPIHDRQTDVIVGGLYLGFALMLQGILLQRYSQYFHLLRVDLAAMWFFVAGSSMLLFGLRPVVRFAWVWVVPLMGFPLGYQLTVILFGGNRPSAGMASLAVAAAATAVSVGRTRSRALIGAVVALLVGLITLAAMATFVPDAPLFAFQTVPAALAMVLAGMSLYFYARRGRVKRVLGRRLEPMATRQAWAGIAVVAVVAAALSLMSLPPPASNPVLMAGMTFGRPLAAPAGWHETAESDYPWVRRLYGRDADLFRQRFVADAGNPAWDKFARPRTVIVDSTSTWRPISLQVYPSMVLYDESASRISDPKFIDLGSGVTGSMVTVVDDKAFLTYNLLTWTWRSEGSAQRIVIASVDNHEDDAVFPEPSGGLPATLRTMFAIFFRGNQATWNSDPVFKDVEMLTEFGRGLVQAQLHRAQAGRAQA